MTSSHLSACSLSLNYTSGEGLCNDQDPKIDRNVNMGHKSNWSRGQIPESDQEPKKGASASFDGSDEGATRERTGNERNKDRTFLPPFASLPLSLSSLSLSLSLASLFSCSKKDVLSPGSPSPGLDHSVLSALCVYILLFGVNSRRHPTMIRCRQIRNRKVSRDNPLRANCMMCTQLFRQHV